MDWYLTVLRKYADFQGRARRKEYWMFFLFNIIVAMVLGILDGAVLHTRLGGFGLLSGLYSLFVIIPGIAVGVRRLHDTNRSGFWMLIAFLPIIGAFVLLVFNCLEGTPGDNDYGPNPKLA
jgi:uncharacterized membrane protein YhaH (DUF805 family)